jgi:hypothetical protein
MTLLYTINSLRVGSNQLNVNCDIVKSNKFQLKLVTKVCAEVDTQGECITKHPVSVRVVVSLAILLIDFDDD